MATICEHFARTLAKQKGITYRQATKMFPRYCQKNTVYKNNYETHTAHCVHCARADVLGRLKKPLKISKVV